MTVRPEGVCKRCGNTVLSGDRFCGNCGAAVLTPAPQAEQVIPQPVAAAQGVGYGGRRRRRVWVNAAMFSLIVLLGVGAIAALAFKDTLGLLGASDQRLTGNGEATPPQSEVGREPTSPGPAPSAPPSSEEALEDFGREYDEAHRSGDWEATYSMLLESTQQNFTEGEWAEKQQTLRDAEGTPAPLESVNVVGAGSSDLPATVTFVHEDGTEEAMNVVESDSGEPERVMTGQEIAELEALSSSGPDEQGIEEIEAEVEEAAGDYYRAAGVEDWSYTYENLDEETRSGFTEEEWSQKNQWLADNGEVIYRVDSAYPVGTSTEYLAVSLTLTYEDGTSSTRETYFIYEEGEWKHRFGQEENDLFMPDATFEEFVEAQR